MPPHPQRRTINGREQINRAGKAELTGLSIGHLKTLWTQRNHNGYPAPTDHLGRTLYWDLEQWQDWYDTHTRQRRERLTPPPQHGDPHELLTMSDIARRNGYAGPATILKWLTDNPGYFPEPDITEPLPSGRVRRKWFAHTLDEFNQGLGRRKPTGRPPTRPQPDACN